MCAKCKRRVESLENHTWGRKSLKGLRNRLLKIRTFITRHLYYPDKFTISSPTSHDTEESENSPESPHLGEIKRMRQQCVPGASPFFARAGDEARVEPDISLSIVNSKARLHPRYTRALRA